MSEGWTCITEGTMIQYVGPNTNCKHGRTLGQIGTVTDLRTWVDEKSRNGGTNFTVTWEVDGEVVASETMNIKDIIPNGANFRIYHDEETLRYMKQKVRMEY